MLIVIQPLSRERSAFSPSTDMLERYIRAHNRFVKLTHGQVTL
jgi:hypothetical protein